jgi:hypothetical protein
MAYQGISPYLYRNNLTNVQLLDDISASFNGTTTQFNLTTNGSPFHAVSARSLLIILGGIVQEPDVDYTVNAGVITFTTAPLSGLTFAARNIYGLNRLTGINDGLVTPASLSLGGPEWDTSGNTTIDGNITQTGDTNNVYINTDTPTVRPTLDLNFERDQRLDSRITFSRNSTATYLGSDGLIKTALAGEPRFEFDSSGNCKGLLSEESRSNFVKASNNFSTWTPSNITIGSSPSISPDGTTNAALLTATATGINYPYAGMFSVLSNNTYTFSVWTKFEISFSILMYGTGFGVLLLFDSTTKQPTTTTINSGTTGITGKVESYPNGWYRVSATITSTGTNFGEATIALNKNKVTTWGLSNASSIGDTLTVWGAQLEYGFFPTSYIPTTTASVTRSSDITTISGTNFSDWYNQSEGTVYSTFNANYVGSTDGGRLFRIGNDTNFGGNRVDYVVTQIGNYQPYLASGGTNYFNGPGTIGFSANTNYKIALTLKQNDITGYVNSSLSTFDNTWVPFTANHLSLGTTIDGGFLNGCIKRFTYYPKRLTNNQLSNLTS